MVRKLRYIASAIAVLAAAGADAQVRCRLWRDLARDWHRWSSAERAVAVFLLFALATMSAFF